MEPAASPTPGYMGGSCALSVVMPLHNALPYADEAIASIVSQTFTDFEFVILDDASTDGSEERLRQWAAQDPRIRLLTSDRNLGPVGSSNMVARAAQAPIVARMDADDISCPTRLAEQMDVLRQHPETGLVASLCDLIDARGRRLRGPETWRLSRRSPMAPFAHGTIMYRRQLFERIGGYRDECEYWEDQDLIMRMAEVSKILVIPKVLYRVRQTTTSTRAISQQEALEGSIGRMYGSIGQAAGRLSNARAARGDTASSLRVDPRVFVSIGSPVLWSGGRPRLFRRFLARAMLRPDVRTATAMIWTALASASPATLRAFLRFLLLLRNAVAGSGPERALIPWAPPAAPEARDRH